MALQDEIKRGQEFLAENKKREVVVELPSGLQYEVMVEGTGKKPSSHMAKVLTHYHSTTIDGVIFDSSVLRGEPISFGLYQVIPGWTEGLQLMPTGSKYKLFQLFDICRVRIVEKEEENFWSSASDYFGNRKGKLELVEF